MLRMIFHDEINGQDASGMNDGVFQQIDGDLLNQHRIHGDHQKFLRDLDPDGGIGIALFQLFQSFVSQRIFDPVCTKFSYLQ